MNGTNMNATEFLKAVDHAAGMNDRWLFLAAFCLLLLVCGGVIFWLVKQLQIVIADHKQAREEHHAALAQIIATQNETALKLAICIDRNTAALVECSFELRRFQERKVA
jgi:type VI protein secretion system component VasK